MHGIALCPCNRQLIHQDLWTALKKPAHRRPICHSDTWREWASWFPPTPQQYPHQNETPYGSGTKQDSAFPRHCGEQDIRQLASICCIQAPDTNGPLPSCYIWASSFSEMCQYHMWRISPDMEIGHPKRIFICNGYSSLETMHALAPKQRLSLIAMWNWANVQTWGSTPGREAHCQTYVSIPSWEDQ